MNRNQTILSRDKICDELAFIFNADPNHIDRLFELGRIELSSVNLAKLLTSKQSIKPIDLFDRSALCMCAQAIFFLCGDEDDAELRDMHAHFILHIIEGYRDADNYGDSIRTRCKRYGVADILDYMCDQISDLKNELDGDDDESDEEVSGVVAPRTHAPTKKVGTKK